MIVQDNSFFMYVKMFVMLERSAWNLELDNSIQYKLGCRSLTIYIKRPRSEIPH